MQILDLHRSKFKAMWQFTEKETLDSDLIYIFLFCLLIKTNGRINALFPRMGEL